MTRTFRMGRLLFALVVVVCANGTCLSASDRPDPAPLFCLEPQAGPCAQLAETTHDFGKVKMGNVYEHEFKVGNSGSETLVIENVKVG
jgi:hypothetical protein